MDSITASVNGTESTEEELLSGSGSDELKILTLPWELFLITLGCLLLALAVGITFCICCCCDGCGGGGGGDGGSKDRRRNTTATRHLDRRKSQNKSKSSSHHSRAWIIKNNNYSRFDTHKNAK